MKHVACIQQSWITAVAMSYIRGSCGVTGWNVWREQYICMSGLMGAPAKRVYCGEVEQVNHGALRWSGHVVRTELPDLAKMAITDYAGDRSWFSLEYLPIWCKAIPAIMIYSSKILLRQLHLLPEASVHLIKSKEPENLNLCPAEVSTSYTASQAVQP